MTDEFEKLEKAFLNEPEIRASKHAKQSALKAALNAYQLENQNSHQGSAAGTRQKGQDNKFVGLFTFSKWRNQMKLSYMLPGAAALATLALVVINTNQFSTLYEPGRISAVTEHARVDATEPALKELAAEETLAGKISPILKKDLDDVSRPRTTPGDEPGSSVKQEMAFEAEQLLQRRIKNQSRKAKPARTIIPAPARPQPMPESSQGLHALKTAPTSTCCEYQAQSLTPQGEDNFAMFNDSPLKLTGLSPVSTFSIDVDTASYGFMRARIKRNLLPPKDAVRVEEMINYFPSDYPGPDAKEQPFQVSTAVLPTPWNSNTRLLHIGIKGYEQPKSNQPKSNLVFLIDTSGSMNVENKLPLLKNSFKLLLSSLSPDDMVSIVAYAGSAGTVLEPTRVREKATILNALNRLGAGGSTAGGQGLRLAYQLAEMNFDAAGVNRVILATDGDFNVGIRSQEELKGFVERKRQSGLFLSVLGFGMGNYNDALMQVLAQNGNGNAAYIDSLSEARKVLVEEASSTLFTIAKAVKIQMEFNPETVKEYRLIG